MSTPFLMPRLSSLGFRRFEMAIDEMTQAQPAARMKSLEEFTSYAASGGIRISSDELLRFREGLVEVASAGGFPKEGDSDARAAFDVTCAGWLVEHGPVQGGEALRDDVWAFVACALAPDIVRWRFSGVHPDRFRGGVRNTFQRLWMRGAVLDNGSRSGNRWSLIDQLTEDALVQITERPAIASEPQLARAIAGAWIRTSRERGASRMEPIMRRAIRRIRVANETVCFSVLDEEALEARFLAYFQEEAVKPDG